MSKAMREQAEILAPDEVLHVQFQDCQSLIPHKTFRVGELIQAIEIKLPIWYDWFWEGLSCQVLRPGKGWIQGKVRICLEFQPDEPETLDISDRSKLKTNLHA